MRRPRRLVYDTNVIISAVLTPAGFCDQLLHKVVASEAVLIVSIAILDEYERVLMRDSVSRIHQWSPAQVRSLVDSVARHSTIVNPTNVPMVITNDPSDNIFLAAAISGVAEFIVSGDRHLLELRSYRGIEVLRPHEMLQLLTTDATS
jgi:putative PIN family toxin of toxin-antitoxin system